jgi:hypothetical protein
MRVACFVNVAVGAVASSSANQRNQSANHQIQLIKPIVTATLRPFLVGVSIEASGRCDGRLASEGN